MKDDVSREAGEGDMRQTIPTLVMPLLDTGIFFQRPKRTPGSRPGAMRGRWGVCQ